MAKIIKKILTGLLIVAALLIFVPAFTALLMRTPKFQTFVVHRFTDHFSKKLGTHISVDHVSYTFFNKLLLYNVLIKDQNSDTLISAREISLRIKDFKPSEQLYRFGKIEVYEPDFRIITDTSGVMNLNWYIEKLKGDNEPDTTKKINLVFPEILVIDGAFSLVNLTDTARSPVEVIDFSDLRLTSLNATLKNMQIRPDSVTFRINDLTFREKSGFRTSGVDMDALVAGESLYFSDVRIITDSSLINAERINIMPQDSGAYSDFVNRVRMNIVLKRSLLNTSDLACFVFPLQGIRENVYLSGKITGTVSDLRGRNIEIEYSPATKLDFNFDVSGLPEVDNVYIFLDFNNLQTYASDIEQISIPGKGMLPLPLIIHDLGKISFRGNFTGFLSDFVAFGTLQTDRGNITTDISLRPEGKNTFGFEGMMKVADIDLGYLAKNEKQLGGLWLHANVIGTMKSFRHLTANINGAIDTVEINGYSYRNVSVAGTYSEKVWDGSVIVDDRNIKMDLLGRFDLSDTLPEFDFTLNLAKAKLHRLNLYEKDTAFNVSALMTATFRGNNIDNLDGDLRLINSAMHNSNGDLTIYDFLVRSGNEKGVPLLSLRSDIADAEIRGNHTYASLGTAAKSIMSQLFPSKYSMPSSKEELKENNFTFKVLVKKVDKLSEFFGNSIRIAEGSTLAGFFNAEKSNLKADIISPGVSLGGGRFNNLTVISSLNGGIMNVLLTSDAFILPGNSELKNLSLQLGTHPDTLNLSLDWDNRDAGTTLGEIKATGYYTRNKKQKAILTVDILPTAVVINKSTWQVSPARIVMDSVTTSFDRLYFSGPRNFLSLDGKISSNPRDRLTLSFDGIDLAVINQIGKKNAKEKEEGSLEMNVGGIMKGEISVSDVHRDFLFESDVTVNGFNLNDSQYGKVTLRSEWNPQNKVAVINAKNDFEGSKLFEISGIYSPSTKTADISATANRLPLNILNSIVKSFASDVRGLGSGKVRMYGKLNKLLLAGSIMAEDASMKVDFLQTRYSFSDSVRFTRKGIEFRNIRVFDEKRNQGTINGILAHNSFNDFSIDLNFNINKMMVLNTKPKDNETFYGTAYATGYAGIKGSPEKLSFNISAKTEDNTAFYIPLNASETVSEYPYIIFVDHRKEEEAAKAREEMLFKKEKKAGMDLTFDLEVTPEAEVQLIMDSKAGDVIRGTGAGKLNIGMTSKGDVKMSGDYIIEDGDYLFTLGNILNKKFSIEEGGSITWNGSLTDADINIRAIYNLETSLYNILPDEAFRERIPVECQLNLSEKLINPAIGFNIDLPTADDETKEYVRAVINTEDKISRQFLYLLVMNSFYPDPSLYSAAPQSTTAGASALGVNTTFEMLSNQVSNWLSQISNDFDIGFVYRPGNEITPQEMKVALSTQLINDKVTLNGNFNYVGKESNTKVNSITGDFDVEFKITDKLKFKVFNRSNDNLFYETQPYTQGFGFFYRRDFDKMKDLFVLPDNRKKKVEGKDDKKSKN